MGALRTVNPEQLGSLFRTLLQFLGGYLVASGRVSDADWQTLSGALLVLVPTVWGLWARSDANLIASAAGVPAVTRIVAPGTAAAGDPQAPKVKST